MQVFSSMRRNSTYKKSVIPIRWMIFLVIYQMATSLYTFLTPLIGFMFCFLILTKDEELKTHDEHTLKRYLGYAYLMFAVLNKGFYLLSGVAFLYFFYHLFAEWMKTTFKCKNCTLLAYVVFGYIGIYGTNNLLAYMFNQPFFAFDWEYGVYMASDFLLTLVFFRDRIL